MRILLVEDDKKLGKIITSFLKKDSILCDLAYDYQNGLQKATESNAYNVIILDVILPDGNGIDLARKLRAERVDTPIIILTSRASTVDRVSGLDAGADDYMPKPFSPEELKARLRAVLRRPAKVVSEEIVCSNVRLNTTSHSVKKDGTEVDLMPTEFNLLEQLMRHKNQVVPKEDLLRNVWGVYSNTGSNRLEVYIRYLREKLDNPFQPELIRTVRGMGYKIADDE